MGIEELIGSLPDGWEYSTLGETCAKGGGDVQTGPFGTQLHASDYVPVGIPSIMPQNIGDNRVVLDGIARITTEDAERLNRYRVRPGDIVYSRRGDVERRALIRSEEDGWLCGTGCLRVRFGKGFVDPRYASYYLGDKRVREWIVRHAHGATMPNLNTSILSNLPFVLPPTEQQRAIGDVLEGLDNKINLNRQMNETLEAMATAVFKDWFVDFSPVRFKAEGLPLSGLAKTFQAVFPNAFEEDNRPAGWAITTLAKVTSKIGSGATPRGGKEVYVDEGMNFIRSQNVYDHQFVWNGLAKITAEDADRLRSVTVEVDDVLINITGDSILRTCVVEQDVLPARVNQHVAIVRPADGIPSRFLHLYLVLPSTKAYLLGNDAGGSRPAVTKGHLEILPLLLPTQPVLTIFKDLTEPWFTLIRKNDSESRTLAALRDLLLPKLMSGEIRLRDAKKIVRKVS